MPRVAPLLVEISLENYMVNEIVQRYSPRDACVWPCASAYSMDMSESRTPLFYSEGQEDLVSRFITPITHIVTRILIINRLTTSP